MGYVPPPSPDLLNQIPGYDPNASASGLPPLQVRPPAQQQVPGGGVPADAPPQPGFQQGLQNQFAPPPPVEPTDPAAGVPTSPGGGTFGESTDDAVDGATARQQLHDYVLDLTPGAKAPQFIRPEGESYTGVGGEKGKEWFQDALIKGPERLEGAIKESEQAQKQKADQLGKFYDQEGARQTSAAAAMQHQRQQDQIELQTRQTNLDKATSFYSNDLADQGKFWTNPGNIISAIAFSLMPIFSNDPTIGVRTVNEAIDRDMANRQHAAGQTLGALQSNLHGYRQIVGDRQAGDLMAESEARRIAADEVARISQKFDSQISKAKAQAIIEDLRMKSATTRMEAYKAWGIHQDAKVMPKQLHEARGQGFEGQWRKYGSDLSALDPAFKQSSGAAVNGSIAGTPSVATSDGKGQLSAQDAAALSSPGMALRATLSGRIPGGVSMADVFKRSVAKQAAAVSGYTANADDKAFAKAKVEIINKAEDDIKGFAPQLAPIAGQRAGITLMQRDMDIIRRSSKNPEDFLNSTFAKLAGPELAAYIANKERQFAGAPKNSAEALDLEQAKAAMRFRSLLGDNMVDYYHSKAGANQAPGELANLKQVIHAGSSWDQVQAFVNNQSIKLDRQAKDILAGASNPLAAMLYMTQTGIGTTRLPSQGVPQPKTGVAAVPQMGMKDFNSLMGAPKVNVSRGGLDVRGMTDSMFGTGSKRPEPEAPAPAAPARPKRY